jgi:hypothetical protein
MNNLLILCTLKFQAAHVGFFRVFSLVSTK